MACRSPQDSADLWAEEFEWLPGAAFSTALALTGSERRPDGGARLAMTSLVAWSTEEAQREGIDDGLFIHLDNRCGASVPHSRFLMTVDFISYAEPIEPRRSRTISSESARASCCFRGSP